MNSDDPFYQLDRRFTPLDGASSGAASEASDGFQASEDGGGGGGGGGGTPTHPFKFVDVSTEGSTAVKIQATSELIDVLYPLSTMPITGPSGTGSFQDDIALTEACSIWLKGTVVSGVCTAAEVTKVDPTDGELITFAATTPFAQTTFYTLLATVTAGAEPNEPGFDLVIGEDPFHLTQAAFNNLRLEVRAVSGRAAIIAVPV